MTIREIERQYGEHRAYMPFALLFLVGSATLAWLDGASWIWVVGAAVFVAVNTLGWWLCREGIREHDEAEAIRVRLHLREWVMDPEQARRVRETLTKKECGR